MEITPQQRQDAIQALRSEGIGTSDCQLTRPDGEDYLELRSFSGTKRIAVVALTLEGKVVGAWRA